MDCLTPEQLERLGGNFLQPEEASALRHHVDGCTACRERLAEWRDGEDMLHELRAVAGSGEADPTRTSVSLLDDETKVSPGAEVAAPDHTSTSRANTFPGYQIVRELNRGGQGVVYEAMQTGTHRRVALKVLREGAYASAGARLRFEREIELAAKLNHPNVVAVFHTGIAADGQPFYVMDYVDGQPLHRYVRQSQLAVDHLLAVYLKICDAVEHAHRHGVIHRDLKPSNILVDADGEPRILDFGLAREVSPTTDQHLTGSHEVMGTLPYMSPEQARGQVQDIDTRTDVYALGVILYELVTGGFPYPVQGELWEVARNIAETPPTPPIQRWTREAGVAGRSSDHRITRKCPIDDDLQTILLKALAKERERRYQGVVELGRDLRHYLAGEAIEAKRDSTWYVLRKLARRHQAATLIAASVLVIILSAAAVALDFYRQKSVALEDRLASETRLADQGRDFDATADGVRAALAQRALGWFLEEWHAGRLDAARNIMAQVPAKLPEYSAMQFVLDPAMTAEQFLEALPDTSVGLAYFVAGERAWQAGRAESAKHWWQLCADGDAPQSITMMAKARLAQLAGDGGPPAASQEPGD